MHTAVLVKVGLIRRPYIRWGSRCVIREVKVLSLTSLNTPDIRTSKNKKTALHIWRAVLFADYKLTLQSLP